VPATASEGPSSTLKVRAHSAVHVLKGALVSVLASGPTASVHVGGGGHGRITVMLERKPGEEEVRMVESRTNAKVSENAEVVEFEMEREEAEGHFGGSIYDLFPVPEGVKHLKLVRIPDWEINCCAEEHVQSTAEIGTVVLEKARFRDSKKMLEVEFRLVEKEYRMK
jgi:alanyl-tRNA synthetase